MRSASEPYGQAKAKSPTYPTNIFEEKPFRFTSFPV